MACHLKNSDVHGQRHAPLNGDVFVGSPYNGNQAEHEQTDHPWRQLVPAQMDHTVFLLADYPRETEQEQGYPHEKHREMCRPTFNQWGKTNHAS